MFVPNVRGVWVSRRPARWTSSAVPLGATLALALTGMARAQSPAPTPVEAAPVVERTGGATGVGFVLGDLDGLSLKYWSDRTHVFQLRVGSASRFNSLGLVATYEYHFRPLATTGDYHLPFYVGGGGRFTVVSSGTTYLDGGLVGVVGMSVLVPTLPVEIFLEVLPTVAFVNPVVGVSTDESLGFTIEGGMGIHYYF